MKRTNGKAGGIPRGLVTAAAAGAAVGLTGGLLRGALEAGRSAYFANGTAWLAWSEMSHRAFRGGALGGALTLAFALLLCSLPPLRRELKRVPFSAAAPVVPLFVLLLGLALALEPVLERQRVAGHPSVVLVSIDTLRADRLVSDEGAVHMPRLHTLAGEGASFTEAMSTAPWTLASHVSLLTSLLPFDHRVRTMKSVIPPQASLLAEHFRNAGYRTAAFTGGVYVGAAFGYTQGFQVFQDHDEEKEGGSAGILGSALAWVRSQGEAPFFLFVHTYQPHIPYRAAPRRDDPRVPSPFTVADAEEIYAGRRVLTHRERREVIGLYDADVRATDAAVGGFLETLRSEGRLDDTILVLVSDHGEDLWDRKNSRAPGHGHALYQELVHVPLVVRAPGRVPPGTRLATPVSLIDVAPTLLEMCGLNAAPSHRGRSLAGALTRGREPDVVPQMAECVQYGPERLTVRQGDLKVIESDLAVVHEGVHLSALPLEVYDLRRDPGEADPASGRHAAGLARALALLRDRERKAGGEPAAAGDLSDDVRERLRSLGYVH